MANGSDSVAAGSEEAREAARRLGRDPDSPAAGTEEAEEAAERIRRPGGGRRSTDDDDGGSSGGGGGGGSGGDGGGDSGGGDRFPDDPVFSEDLPPDLTGSNDPRFRPDLFPDPAAQEQARAELEQGLRQEFGPGAELRAGTVDFAQTERGDIRARIEGRDIQGARPGTPGFERAQQQARSAIEQRLERQIGRERARRLAPLGAAGAGTRPIDLEADKDFEVAQTGPGLVFGGRFLEGASFGLPTEFTVESREVPAQPASSGGAPFAGAMTSRRHRRVGFELGVEQELAEETGLDLEFGEDFTIEQTDEGARVEFTDAGKRQLSGDEFERTFIEVPTSFDTFRFDRPGPAPEGVGIRNVEREPLEDVLRGIEARRQEVAETTAEDFSFARGVGPLASGTLIGDVPRVVQQPTAEVDTDSPIQEQLEAGLIGGSQFVTAPVSLGIAGLETAEFGAELQEVAEEEGVSTTIEVQEGEGVEGPTIEFGEGALGFAAEESIETGEEFVTGIETQLGSPTGRAGLAGSLVGSAAIFGGAAAIGPRAGLAARATIQPGEEALGFGGFAITRRVAGRGAAQRAFPNKEPLIFSEEAALRRARGATQRGMEATRRARRLARGEEGLPPSPRQSELIQRFRPTEPAISEPLGGAGSGPLLRTEMFDPVEETGLSIPSIRVEPRMGAGLVPPRVEIDFEETQPEFDPNRGEVLGGGASEVAREQMVERQKEARRMLGGEFEGEFEPFAEVGRVEISQRTFEAEAEAKQERRRELATQVNDLGLETFGIEDVEGVETEGEEEMFDILDIEQELEVETEKELEGLEIGVEKAETPGFEILSEFEREQEQEQELELELETEQELEFERIDRPRSDRMLRERPDDAFLETQFVTGLPTLGEFLLGDPLGEQEEEVGFVGGVTVIDGERRRERFDFDIL